QETRSSTVTPKMVKTFHEYLAHCHRTYSCVHCRAHLASHDELISKSFQGSQGRAYLFNSVVNIGCGPAEERFLLTGLHAVADIHCESCKTTLGWKYVSYSTVSHMAMLKKGHLAESLPGFLRHAHLPAIPLSLMLNGDLRTKAHAKATVADCGLPPQQVSDVFAEYYSLAFACLQEHAFESSQKYKEGKYIIELAHMIKENGWGANEE
ncbi:protein yippee 2-like, partial [Tropilaelaps mercedesae]